MNILCIGIDPSLTSTGIVALKGEDVVKCVTLPNKPGINPTYRVLSIINDMNKLIWDVRRSHSDINTNVIVAVEGFSYGSKGKSVFEIGYLGWRIREELIHKYSDLIKWIDVPPNNLKLYATGKGNSPKELILQQVYKRWGQEFSDNNQSDAYVLAKMAQSYLLGDEGLTDFQIKSMNAVRGLNKK